MKKKMTVPAALLIALTLVLTTLSSFAEPADGVPHKGEYPLSDTSEGHVTPDGVAAGYWMHPYVPDRTIEILFNSPIWVCGFSFFAWAPYSDLYVDVEFSGTNGEVLYSGRCVCYDNNFVEVGFDKSYPPGLYMITFTSVENPEFPNGEGQHFVLGSGKVREDLDPEDIDVVAQCDFNNSLGAPEIILFEGDPDPDYVAPTEVPTATPTPEPTDPPAGDPTKAPDSEPTENAGQPTDKPADTPKKKGCGNVISAGFVSLTLAAAAAYALRKKH